jgi:Methyltransferase domain
MDAWIERIERLDLSLYSTIPSLTVLGDKRSLLAVQRATANVNGEYVYLEIGAYLGGSIQPHLVDERCKRIYAIDPRPGQSPDDRAAGHIAHYENNSTEEMISRLGRIGHGDLSKIVCFDLDASDVDPGRIENRPHLIFIDGEHTKRAVISDFQFCIQVVHEKGTILFHDFHKIHEGILEICASLDRQRRPYTALKLEGAVFAILFDADRMLADRYLADWFKRKRFFWPLFRFKQRIKKVLPGRTRRKQ